MKRPTSVTRVLANARWRTYVKSIMNNDKEHPFQPGAKVVGYLRDSGGDEQDLSLAQQANEITIWAHANSLIITRIFQDEAQPGSSVVKRESFMEMINHFRDGAKEEGVVIWSYSRFSRDIDDAAFFKSDLRRRGYLIYSRTDSIPLGLDGYLLESVLAWKDARFLEDLSRDVKRGLAHLVREYKAVPGRPPKGFRRKPINIGKKRDGKDRIVHQWVPDPKMVPIVQKAFMLRAAGKTYNQIRKETGLYGAKTSYIRMFHNEIFRGRLKYGDLMIEDYCEPIIDKETWDKVQELHHKRSVYNNPLHPRRMSSSFILSGLMFCANCNSPMNGQVIHSSNSKVYTYYVCSRRKRRNDCDARNIPQAVLETKVLEELRTEILTPENLSRLQEEMRIVYEEKQRGRVGEREHLSKQLTKTARQLSNVAEALSETGGSHTLLEKLVTLEAEEGELRTRIDALDRSPEPNFEVDLYELSLLITQVLDETRLEEKENRKQIKELLGGFIHRIEVIRKKKKVNGTIYYYKPELDSHDLKKKISNPLVPISAAPVGALQKHKFTGRIVRRNAKKAS